MTRGDWLRPKNPTHKEILDTLNDKGLAQWRNPMHLAALDSPKWPHPHKDDWRGGESMRDERINGLEAATKNGPSHHNGFIHHDK
jgi:hypothetical protein